MWQFLFWGGRFQPRILYPTKFPITCKYKIGRHIFFCGKEVPWHYVPGTERRITFKKSRMYQLCYKVVYQSSRTQLGPQTRMSVEDVPRWIPQLRTQFAPLSSLNWFPYLTNRREHVFGGLFFTQNSEKSFCRVWVPFKITYIMLFRYLL